MVFFRRLTDYNRRRLGGFIGPRVAPKNPLSKSQRSSSLTEDGSIPQAPVQSEHRDGATDQVPTQVPVISGHLAISFAPRVIDHSDCNSNISFWSGDSSDDDVPEQAIYLRDFDGGSDTFNAPADSDITAFSSSIFDTKPDSTSQNIYLIPTDADDDYCWDTLKLRDLTDLVRECIEVSEQTIDNLESCITIPQEHAADLLNVLTSLVEDENLMTIYDIVDSYMDKLVRCMVADAVSIKHIIPDGLIQQCQLLSVTLPKRFGVKWDTIDEIRQNDMLGGTVKDLMTKDGLQVIDEVQQGGILRGMSMRVVGTNPKFCAPITTLAAARSRIEGALKFKPGDWWPNNASAARDGIITSRESCVTLSPNYGPTALMLLTGEEAEGPTLDLSEWTVLESSREAELIHLMIRNGPFRLLRGALLKSPYAPVVGIRYDGLYRVYQYGIRTDPVENCRRYTIKLTRLDCQGPLAQLMSIPKPHQRDQFRIYQKWVGAEMMAQAGEDTYAKWRRAEEKQKREKEDYMNAKRRAGAESDIRRYTIVPRKANYKQE